MKLVLSLLLLILPSVAPTTASIKAPAAPACPIVSVGVKIHNPRWAVLSSSNACPGAPVTFTAHVDAVGPNENPGFQWTVSAGKILRGQGTSTLTVSTEGAGLELTASVRVTGIPAVDPGCDMTASETVGVAAGCLAPCSVLSMSCPALTTGRGKTWPVSVAVNGGDPDSIPRFKWDVSDGKIVSGQGTAEIVVDITHLAGQSVTATVEVDGLPPECQKAASCSLIIEYAPTARKFDQYDDGGKSEEVRLNNYAIQLTQEPGSVGYVIAYGARHVNEHLARVRDFLITDRQIDPDRIVTVNGGHNRKTRVELWLAPTGSLPPKPDPNFKD